MLPAALTIGACAVIILANTLRKRGDQGAYCVGDRDERLERLCRFGEGPGFHSHPVTDERL